MTVNLADLNPTFDRDDDVFYITWYEQSHGPDLPDVSVVERCEGGTTETYALVDLHATGAAELRELAASLLRAADVLDALQRQ